MKNAILKVLKYFKIFNYPPTFEEIYTFLPKKTSKKELKKELERLVNKKIIVNCKLKIENCFRYTLGEYGIKISNIKYQISKRKLQNWRFRLYLRLLSFFPQIKLVGLSGSMAMMNAKEEDDIDLFIITARNRLFTGRFIAIILAQILGIKRARDSARPIFITRESHPDVRRGPLESEKIVRASSLKHKNKICLNLFFDEGNLEVPDFKKTEYVAHEVLQMKPIINKSESYEKFLRANRWVSSFFPNAVAISNIKYQISKLHIKNQKYFLSKILHFIFAISFLIFDFIQNRIEQLLKKLQLFLIKKHRTNEIISNTQLWFHPEDFGRKIKMLKKDRD